MSKPSLLGSKRGFMCNMWEYQHSTVSMDLEQTSGSWAMMTRSSLLRLLPETKFPKLSTGDASGDLEDIEHPHDGGKTSPPKSVVPGSPIPKKNASPNSHPRFYLPHHWGSDGPLFARPGCYIRGRLMLIDDIDWIWLIHDVDIIVDMGYNIDVDICWLYISIFSIRSIRSWSTFYPFYPSWDPAWLYLRTNSSGTFLPSKV